MTKIGTRGFVAFGAIAGVFVLLTAVRWCRVVPPDTRQQRFEESKPVLASLAMNDLSVSNVRDSVSKMSVENRASASSDVVDALRATILEYLVAACVQSAGGFYAVNREADGYTLRSMDEMNSGDWTVDMSRGYLQAFADGDQHSIASGADARTTFEDVRRVSRLAGGGINEPTELAADSQGLLTIVSVMTDSNQSWPTLEGALTSKTWHGGVSAGGRRWWNPPVRLADLLATEGKAVIAQTGVIMQFRNAVRRPMLLHDYWDAAGQRWLLEGVTFTNFPSGELVWPAEF